MAENKSGVKEGMDVCMVTGVLVPPSTPLNSDKEKKLHLMPKSRIMKITKEQLAQLNESAAEFCELGKDPWTLEAKEAAKKKAAGESEVVTTIGGQ